MFELSFSHSKNIFNSEVCYVALTRYLNLNCKMQFPAIFDILTFDIFCPSGATMVHILGKTKTSEILKGFFMIEKLIRTLWLTPNTDTIRSKLGLTQHSCFLEGELIHWAGKAKSMWRVTNSWVAALKSWMVRCCPCILGF